MIRNGGSKAQSDEAEIEARDVASIIAKDLGNYGYNCGTDTNEEGSAPMEWRSNPQAVLDRMKEEAKRAKDQKEQQSKMQAESDTAMKNIEQVSNSDYQSSHSFTEEVHTSNYNSYDIYDQEDFETSNIFGFLGSMFGYKQAPQQQESNYYNELEDDNSDSQVENSSSSSSSEKPQWKIDQERKIEEDDRRAKAAAASWGFGWFNNNSSNQQDNSQEEESYQNNSSDSNDYTNSSEDSSNSNSEDRSNWPQWKIDQEALRDKNDEIARRAKWW